MALNSPLLQSLVDKINYKSIIELNSVCGIPNIDLSDNIHVHSDPIHELFLILWKCYTIYYQLFDKVETCNVISKYNDIVDKILDKEENISLRSTITNNVKKEKIEELNKLIKRFKYLKNIVVNKKEKVQINNLWDRQLNEYPFYLVHDSQIIKNPDSISKVTGYDDNAYRLSNGLLVFIVDKETDKLVACAIRKGYTYVVYKSNNISDINGNNDYIIRKIYNIIRQRIKVVYKQDIPILTLSEDYERIFLELSDIIGMIKHEYTNSTFNELINTVFIKSCDIYYLHIPDITNYSSALSYKFLNSNTYKNKFITYHNELIAPYNLATEIKSLFLNIDNITNTITLASCIKDIDEENVKYNKVIANLYKISKEIYKCELINNEYKSTILKYIKRLLINKAYKKQFDDNLYNYLVPVHNKLLTIGTKYKLCSNIKPL
nr:MAG TPA: hypothetical protein [Bacteriophage sp.]